MSTQYLKLSIETIGKIKITFNVIVNEEKHSIPGSLRQFPPNIEKYYYNGETYINVSGAPYVKLDFSSQYEKRQLGLNKNRYINLRKIDMFKIRKGLSQYLNAFLKYEKEIFTVSENGDIVLNKELSSSFIYTETLNSKVLKIEPAVIVSDAVDSDDARRDKGFIMYINNISDYVNLTIEELEYLYYTLRNIDMNTMAYQAILLYLNMKDIKPDKENSYEPLVETNSIDRSKDSKPQEGFFGALSVRNNSPGELPNI